MHNPKPPVSKTFATLVPVSALHIMSASTTFSNLESVLTLL